MDPFSFDVLRKRIEDALADGRISERELLIGEAMKVLATPVLEFFKEEQIQKDLFIPFISSLITTQAKNMDEAIAMVKDIEKTIIVLDKHVNEVE